MNPNQKIITLGSASLTIAIVCLLIQIAILATTMTLHFTQNESDDRSGYSGIFCESTIIERNITEIVHLNGTIIERESCPKPAGSKNWSKPQCQIAGFAPFSKDNSIRLSAGGDIWVTKEPYVSCSLNKYGETVHAQGTTLDNRHSNGTTHDRSPYRTLLMSEFGVSIHIGTKQVCIAWSSSSCHDGRAWLHVCITGDDKNATASIIYDGLLTDSIRSWSRSASGSQELEYVCINGACTVVLTSGSASGMANTRIIFIREGKIVHITPISRRISYGEDCPHYPQYPKVRCVCRDNWKGSNRPVLYIQLEDYNMGSNYVCSRPVGDTPRSDDSSSSSNCRDPNNERGGPGVKGWAFDKEDDVWMGRTIKKDSRAGYELFRVVNGWTVAASKSQTTRQAIVESDDRSGHSGILSAEGKTRINRCFYVELTRGRPQETRVWWTSNSIIVFCGTSGAYGTGSWPDGANINFMPI
ncbi:neuraminidase [Influenza A virus]